MERGQSSKSFDEFFPDRFRELVGQGERSRGGEDNVVGEDNVEAAEPFDSSEVTEKVEVGDTDDS